ncbi:MAG TPA: cysteine--tRNA ligase [Parcubacteria group bacterium]|nr:cysteine--tRNA ligase [Parcubacteria group bacterium]
MEIHLHNTLTGAKEVFKPIKEKQVSMYNCGPTVYDYAHIGNLRAYVFADTLRRVFEYNDYTVNQVVNVTDIGHLSSDGDDGEDKMTKALKREGKPLTLSAMREVADFYFEKFKEDLKSLNIEMPEHFPFASDHIKEDIELVERLDNGGFTYKTSDGIYFDIKKFPDYGKLGNIKIGEETESRIGVNPEKRNSQDFAVWKFNNEIGYDAQFGKGFPGWHIECSAMSVKYLGSEFDIHTGGIDHIPVHHNNEIAQSVCAGDPYARYWMHNAHLNIATANGSDKMAKSGDNFITLQTLKEKKIDPLALRYVFLGARYSSPLQFSWETLEGAQIALNRIRQKISKLPEGGVIAPTDFLKFINDDLDTPKVLALISEILSSGSINEEDKKATLLDIDKVLGLDLTKVVTFEIPTEVHELIKQRDIARAEKDFAKSDELRDIIEELGFKVKDTESGTQIDLT